MKHLYQRIFFFSFIVLLTVSCKKDKQAPTALPAVSLIKVTRMPAGDEESLITYTYDGNQRLISSKLINPVYSRNQNANFSYEYQNDRLVAVKSKTETGGSTSKYNYDGSGRITNIQVIPLYFHQMADGTFVPYNEIKDQYNFSYDNGGRVTRIELAQLPGTFNSQEKHLYYNYEYNSKNEITKLIWQEKGDYAGGNTTVFDGWTDELNFNPQHIGMINYGDLNSIVFGAIKKLPKSMKLYFNTDINGKVYGENIFDYKIANKKLESVTTTAISYSWDTDTIESTLAYKYDFSY